MPDEITEKDILVLSDDIRQYTGFAVNGRLVTHALSQEYDVANASPTARFVGEMEVQGDTLDVYPCPGKKKSQNKGKEGMKQLLKKCNPDYIVSLIDVQMCNYLSTLKQPKMANIPIREAGEDVNKQVAVQRFAAQMQNTDFGKEFEWVAQVPIDGDPIPDKDGQFFREVDHTIAMSRFGKRAIKDQFPEIDVDVIPHGLDYRNVQSEDTDYFLVGSVNKNQFRKQYPRLIEACGKFYRKAGKPDDVRFYFHCDFNGGKSGWNINRFLERHGIADVTIPAKGMVSREELMTLYDRFDVFGSATAGEGFGLTTIEAMAQGTPVVITDYTTSEELVERGEPGPRGKLVEPETMYDEVPRFSSVRRALVDTDDFADALNKYYRKDNLRKEHGQNAENWVHKELSWEKVSQEWLDFFDDIS